MQKVAVIGLANVFPGSTSPEEFWQKLLDKVDCRSEATNYQMGDDPNRFYKPNKGGADWFYCKMGGYIHDFKLDPKGFHLPAEFIDSLDDLFKWSLHAAREALRDSGYLDNDAVLQQAGVVLGNLSFPTKLSNQLFLPLYQQAIQNSLRELIKLPNFQLKPHTQPQTVNPYNGYIAGYPAAVIAQSLGIKGVNFALDAACASSLYSVKLACDFLTTGKQDLMLAGAVSGGDPLFVNLGFSIFQAYPENGIHAPFDKNSQGLFAGEGAGVLVLKRYTDAVRDGDKIYAVIRGAGLSNDGKGQHVLSPNTKGQVKAYERAYQDAEVAPTDIDFVECHATGTPLGDKVELGSMETFFCAATNDSSPCSAPLSAPYIGSVKSNLGHLLTAAGMPGMFKVMLGMQKGLIPPTINLKQPIASPNGKMNGGNIVSETIEWPKNSSGRPRRAGVSVFGFGGANAHVVFEQDSPALRQAVREHSVSTKPAQLKMAIVGMDVVFGGCEGLSEFHETILSGKQHFKPLSSQRWEGLNDDASLLAALGITRDKLPQGAYLDSFDFNFMHFRVPPNEDDRLIPQQLITMKVADRAITEANLQTSSNVAVLVAMGVELELHQIRGRVNMAAQLEDSLRANGVQLTDEQRSELERIAKDSIHAAAKLNQYTSAIGNIMASRISSLWDFSGPAFTVSAEENSVTRCLEIAENLLLTSDVEAVVVAAVDLAGSAESILLRNALAQWNLSKCSMSFEQEANGWSVGEGAGALVLKRLDDAKAQHQPIYATIDAIGTALGANAQAVQAAAEIALQRANRRSEDIEYIEAHASGIPHEDVAEFQGLEKVYIAQTDDKNIAVGSVKANIGHTFSASGIASLIKTALCLRYRFIPGVPQWQAPKELAQWQQSAFYVQSQSKTWYGKGDKPRTAAVNMLGIDGTAAHIILAEYSAQVDAESEYMITSDITLIPVYGNSEQEILSVLSTLTEQLNGGSRLVAMGREQLENAQGKQYNYVLALVAKTPTELLQEIKGAQIGVVNAIKNQQDWISPRGSCFAAKPLGRDGKITFVYPGGFTSYIGLGKELFQLFPSMHGWVKKHTSRLGEMLGDKLFHPRTIQPLTDDEIKQRSVALINTPIAMFESGICYAAIFTQIMRHYFKLHADSAIGYSMGEISMMYALGVWDSSDEMSQILNSNPVFNTRLAGPMETVREAWSLRADVPDDQLWAGYTVMATPEQVQQALLNEDKVFLLLINTAQEVVIAGEPQACKRVVAGLGCEYFIAPMSDVIHNPLVRADFAALTDLHRMPVNKVSGAKLFSAVGYKPVAIDSEGIARNIAEMYCNSVDFPRLVNTAYDDGSRIFVELGPRDSCSKYVTSALQGREHLAVAINRKGSDDKTSLIRLLARLASHQVAVDLSVLYQTHRKVEPQKKGLVIPIQLGGKRIQDKILDATTQTGFAQITQTATQINLPQPIINLRMASGAPWLKQVNHALALLTPLVPTKVPAKTPANQSTSNQSISNKLTSNHENKKLMNNLKDSGSASLSFAEGTPQYEKYKSTMSRVSATHAAFLESRQAALKQVGELIQLQANIAAGNVDLTTSAYSTRALPGRTKLVEQFAKPEKIIWDTADLVEFAEGDIGKVFGKEYAIIDTYKRRVRLPTTDYLLVTRVTELDAETNKYRPSSMTTEYDIPVDAPYLIDGQIPWSVAVESGQCDLLLISYIGIDFQSKGDRVYRLLDCTMTFIGDIALGGQTLRYDIKIDSYARNGDALLFFFHYDCYVGDQKVLIMRGGCAGFFTDKELEDGKGVIATEADMRERANVVKQNFTPLLQCQRRTFEIDDMRCLIRGDMATVFGPAYDQRGLNPSLLFSSEKFLMIERVVDVDLKGGPWGLGKLVGHKQLDPEHWYFPCHFKGDQVMAGSLMSEGCCQLLQFYMMYLGLQTKVKNARFQPLQNQPQKVRCRGQVLPQRAVLEYHLEVLEIGLEPYPFARANVDIILNGKIVVDFKNVCAVLKEQSDEIEILPTGGVPTIAGDRKTKVTLDISPTAPLMRVEPDMSVSDIKGVRPLKHIPAPAVPNDNRVPDTAPFQPFHLFEFATGDISLCFGPEFGFYKDITPPRTPCGDLQLTTRITEVRGKRGNLKTPSYCKGEYEVPRDAWYFRENSHPTVMPYSVIMEISLQPNGFVSAWVGTTLRFPNLELFFRNLDGEGTLLRDVDLRGKTIVNDSNLLSTVVAGTNIIQSFDFTLSTDNEPFYRGTAVFGYFVAGALKDQLGLDNGKISNPWHVDHNIAKDKVTVIDLISPAAAVYQAKPGKPYYHLAGGQLHFVDRVEIVDNGGKAGKGYVYAERKIDPQDWFFPFHFHQDPVMPGSLGVEAIIEAMQVYALHHDLGAGLKNPQFAQILSTIKWKYRGQINPLNRQMSLDIHITNVIREAGRVTIIGDANLSKDGLRIYEVANIAICLKEAE